MTESWEPLEVRVIDALVRDLGTAELPQHKTVKYKRPRAVLPEDCPILCVWLLQKVYGAETVSYWDAALGVGISWQEESVEQAETLMADEEASKSQLRAVSQIEEVIFRVSINGLVVQQAFKPDGREADAVYGILPVGWDLSNPTGVEEGLVEGYAMTVEVDLTQTKVQQGG